MQRIWSSTDWLLSALAAFLAGLLVGALLHMSVRDYFWLLLVVLILLAIKPAYAYWKYRQRRRGAEAALKSE